MVHLLTAAQNMGSICFTSKAIILNKKDAEQNISDLIYNNSQVIKALLKICLLCLL